MPTIYVDADACPVKDERSTRSPAASAGTFLSWPTPSSARRCDPRIRFVLVDAGPDIADDWIAERAGQGGVVVTNDIPLAGRSLEKGAEVISPTAKVFTSDMIGAALATRGLMEHLRSVGEITTGPKPFSPKDRSAFLSALDAAINRAKRKAA